MSKKRGDYPIDPPIKPMLAKLTDGIPKEGNFLYEPKWDGFRALVFKGDSDVFIQSRGERPFNRYFPELEDAFARLLPKHCVLDGEIIIRTDDGLDFDALQLRLHPAESRVEMLSEEIPASFVAFDVLASDGEDRMAESQKQRRERLEKLLDGIDEPVYLTPVTRDRDTAEVWFKQFEGAGLDGLIIKPLEDPYQPGKRSMIKVKHARTADCVVGGFRWYKDSKMVGSLLLGLYDEQGVLHHAGIASSFSKVKRERLTDELAPLRKNAAEGHPWIDQEDEAQRTPGGESRWSAGKDLSWEPLRIERVVEVKYDHMQGDRFRHATRFVRWRTDKQPSECTYEQLEEARSYDLEDIFAKS